MIEGHPVAVSRDFRYLNATTLYDLLLFNNISMRLIELTATIVSLDLQAKGTFLGRP
jgi:hypothetical protein